MPPFLLFFPRPDFRLILRALYYGSMVVIFLELNNFLISAGGIISATSSNFAAVNVYVVDGPFVCTGVGYTTYYTSFRWSPDKSNMLKTHDLKTLAH